MSTEQASEQLRQLQACIPKALATLERQGYSLIYQDEDKATRRKELRAQGITKIRCVPFNRAKAQETR